MAGIIPWDEWADLIKLHSRGGKRVYPPRFRMIAR